MEITISFVGRPPHAQHPDEHRSTSKITLPCLPNEATNEAVNLTRSRWRLKVLAC